MSYDNQGYPSSKPSASGSGDSPFTPQGSADNSYADAAQNASGQNQDPYGGQNQGPYGGGAQSDSAYETTQRPAVYRDAQQGYPASQGSAGYPTSHTSAGYPGYDQQTGYAHQAGYGNQAGWGAQQQQAWGTPQHQAPVATPASTGPADDNAFAALTDFSFTKMATPGLVKILYIAAAVFGILQVLGFTFSAFTFGGQIGTFGVVLGLLSLIGGLVGLVVFVLAVRIYLEIALSVVRSAQDVRAIRNKFDEADD
jgi:hypothetical protein